MHCGFNMPANPHNWQEGSKETILPELALMLPNLTTVWLLHFASWYPSHCWHMYFQARFKAQIHLCWLDSGVPQITLNCLSHKCGFFSIKKYIDVFPGFLERGFISHSLQVKFLFHEVSSPKQENTKLVAIVTGQRILGLLTSSIVTDQTAVFQAAVKGFTL